MVVEGMHHHDDNGEEMNMGQTVSFTRDTSPDGLQRFAEEHREELQRLAAMPDDQINYDDIPELTDAQLAKMKRVEPYPR